jgi:hypothetical protein
MNSFLKFLNDDVEHSVIAHAFFNYKLEIDQSKLDYNRFFNLIVNKHKIINHFWEQIAENNYPDNFILKIKSQRIRQKQRALKQLSVLIELNRILSSYAFIVLKGLPLSQILYEDFSFRDVVDIDILVKPEETSIILDILEENLFLIKREAINTRFRHHIHASKNNVSIEIHWQIAPINELKKEFYINLWKNSEELNIQNNVFKVPNLDFQYLIMLIHNASHKWERISWIQDFKRITNILLEKTYLSKIENQIIEYNLNAYYKTGKYVINNLFNSNYNKVLSIKEKMIVKDILNINNNAKIYNKMRNNLFFFLLNDNCKGYCKSFIFSFLRIVHRE